MLRSHGPHHGPHLPFVTEEVALMVLYELATSAFSGPSASTPRGGALWGNGERERGRISRSRAVGPVFWRGFSAGDLSGTGLWHCWQGAQRSFSEMTHRGKKARYAAMDLTAQEAPEKGPKLPLVSKLFC